MKSPHKSHPPAGGLNFSLFRTFGHWIIGIPACRKARCLVRQLADGIWNLGFALLLLLLPLLSPLNTLAQTKWYKYPGSIESHRGKEGWYPILNYKNVIYENGMYRMWYAANTAKWSRPMRYATSKDGISWMRYEVDSMKFDGIDKS